MNRKKKILERCGFRIVSCGDLDGDGDVDSADLEELAAGYGERYGLVELMAVRDDFGKHGRPTLLHGATKHMLRYPGDQLETVHTIWPRTPQEAGRAAKSIKKQGGFIAVIDNERSGQTVQKFRKLLALMADMCDAIRNEGISPGVCSIAPWSFRTKLSSHIIIDEANGMVEEVLLPHVDWLAWEFYGPGLSDRLLSWVMEAHRLKWDVCFLPYLHPYSFSQKVWVDLDEWLDALGTARRLCDATVLWSDATERWWSGRTPGSLSGRWIYDLLALKVWGMTNKPPWLEITKGSRWWAERSLRKD